MVSARRSSWTRCRTSRSYWFLLLLATRHGQVLNRSDLAAPLGLSVPTITQWLGIPESTGQILAIPPFYEKSVEGSGGGPAVDPGAD